MCLNRICFVYHGNYVGILPKGGTVTCRRVIFETIPGYSFFGVYTVLVRRRPPEEMGVTPLGYSTSGGVDVTPPDGMAKFHRFSLQ